MNRKVQKQTTIKWKRRTQGLMDSLNIGYILCDLEDNVLDVNEAYLKMTGWKRQQIVGHNVSAGYNKAEYKKLRKL